EGLLLARAQEREQVLRAGRRHAGSDLHDRAQRGHTALQGRARRVTPGVTRLRGFRRSGALVRPSSGHARHGERMTTSDRSATLRQMLNKVPEVTLYFWVIKILCTTVGETASDYLSENLSLGLTNTTFITATVLVGALVFQFRA